MRDRVAALGEDERARLQPSGHPEWRAPMLATLTEEHFSDPNWVFERKLDGERALAFRDHHRVRLQSRNRKSLNATYPELIEALAGQPSQDFVADGEIVAFDGAITSFARLQGRMQLQDPEAARASGITVFFYLFDLLHLDGRDLRALPLRARKQLLRDVIRFDDPLRFSRHRNREGDALFDEACRKGWEGLIAKRADSSYGSSRSSDWLKFKCTHGQELVIGGFTRPKGTRTGLGALLVGHYDDGRLRYAGRVGTGFDTRTLEHLSGKLKGLAQDRSPFADLGAGQGVTWVQPRLVAEIAFSEWTEAGRLRHPRFLGLRRDKDPREVRREQP